MDVIIIHEIMIIIVNRFRYKNNVLGLHKFSLQTIIDRHGPSKCSGYYTTSINCCKQKTFYCNDSKIMEFEMNDTKTPLLHM